MRRIVIFVQDGLNRKFVESIRRALDYFIINFNLDKSFSVDVFHDWKLDKYQESGNFIPLASLRWLVEQGYKTRLIKEERNLNTRDVLNNLQIINLINGFDRSLFITCFSLNHERSGYNFGTTTKHFCSVISTTHLHLYSEEISTEWLYYLALHEIGHLFGLVSRYQSDDELGTHCPNKECIMHKFSLLPDDLTSNVKTGYLARDLKFCLDCIGEVSKMKNELLVSVRQIK